MFTHIPPTVSLQGITARLAQARFPSLYPLARKDTHLSHISTPTKTSMYPARSVQRDTAVLPAAPQTKFQQARTRRPHYESNPNRTYRQPETTRKPHYQDWNDRHGTGLTKSLPCKPVSRRPFQDIQASLYDQRSTSHQPNFPAHIPQKAGPMSSQAQSRMSEMYDMIDDHLAWNMSVSNSESTRPDSSGTMFVDFDTNGDIEVSYRKGVNKRLPTPPVPAKPLDELMPLHQDVERGTKKVVYGEILKEIEREPVPLRSSYSSRHGSIASSSRPEKVDTTSPVQSRPRVPQKSSRRSRPYMTRKSYPPQVHRTQSSSPAPSYEPTSSTHRPRDRTTNIDAPDLEVQYHASPSPFTTHSTRNTTSGSVSRAYVADYDPTIKSAYHCDDRKMYTHASPVPSRPSSHTSENLEIFMSSYSSSSANYSGVHAKMAEKPLPRVPHSQVEPATKKRRKSVNIMQNLLHKLDGLGAMRELRSERRRSWEKGKTRGIWMQSRRGT